MQFAGLWAEMYQEPLEGNQTKGNKTFAHAMTQVFQTGPYPLSPTFVSRMMKKKDRSQTVILAHDQEE